MIYITTTFSPSMVSNAVLARGVGVDMIPVSAAEVRRVVLEHVEQAERAERAEGASAAHAVLQSVSAVPTASMAAILTDQLGLAVAHNRQSLRVGVDDVLFVAALNTGRLPDGATSLPPGSHIQWLSVSLVELEQGEPA